MQNEQPLLSQDHWYSALDTHLTGPYVPIVFGGRIRTPPELIERTPDRGKVPRWHHQLECTLSKPRQIPFERKGGFRRDLPSLRLAELSQIYLVEHVSNAEPQLDYGGWWFEQFEQ